MRVDYRRPCGARRARHNAFAPSTDDAQSSADPPREATAPRARERLLAEVAALPNLPGVYRYFDAAEQRALRRQGARPEEARLELLPQAPCRQRRRDLDRPHGRRASRAWRRRWCAREAEALLLENNLIKTLAPRFNIRFVDDKSYPYLKIESHRFPRVAYYRGAVDQKHRYFGPFPSAWAVKESIQLLQKVFHLRTCEDTVFANRTRPCLLYQIKRCSGPCVDYIAPEDYARDVANAERFLHGEQQELMDSLQAQMMARAEALQFEQAAELRNQIGSLSRVLHQQSVEDNTGGARPRRRHPRGQGRRRPRLRQPGDGARRPPPRRPAVLPEAGRGRDRGGAPRRRRAKRATTPQAEPPSPEVRVLEAFIAQHYLEGGLPPLLVVSHAGRQGADRGAGGAAAASRVTVQHQPREQRRAWLDMCIKGAELRLAQLLAEEGSQQARTRALVDALDLAGRGPGRLPHRVLRRQPHRRRVDAGVVRRLRGAQDAERAVPPLQHRRHHAGRRLRGDAPGADAPLRQAGRGGERRATGAPARPGAGRRRARPGRRGARGVRGARHRARRASSASRRAKAARSASRSWCSPTAGRRSRSAASRRR